MMNNNNKDPQYKNTVTKNTLAKNTLLIPPALIAHKETIDTYLQKILADLPSISPLLKQAMGDALQQGGKRIRPHLSLLSAQLFGLTIQQGLPTAAAIECIHSYSLVHDDLPAMDNAQLRRGLPSCWVKHGESTAILVGDALIPLAFEILSRVETHFDPTVRISLIQELAKASGAAGIVCGQMLDMAPSSDWSLADIQQMQDLKTGVLIAYACKSGAILAQQPPSVCAILQQYGFILGLIFQITDDLLDCQSHAAILGKPTGQDAQKQTFVSRLGIEGAQGYVQTLYEKAHTLLGELKAHHIQGDLTDFYHTLDYVTMRQL